MKTFKVGNLKYMTRKKTLKYFKLTKGGTKKLSGFKHSAFNFRSKAASWYSCLTDI